MVSSRAGACGVASSADRCSPTPCPAVSAAADSRGAVRCRTSQRHGARACARDSAPPPRARSVRTHTDDLPTWTPSPMTTTMCAASPRYVVAATRSTSGARFSYLLSEVRPYQEAKIMKATSSRKLCSRARITLNEALLTLSLSCPTLR